MVCETLQQLIRVAIAGSRKMDSQGYGYELVRYGNGASTPVVINPNGDRYITQTRVGLCNCAFHRANRKQFGKDTTCKHLEWLRAREEEEERLAAMEPPIDACDGDHRYSGW